VCVTCIKKRSFMSNMSSKSNKKVWDECFKNTDINYRGNLNPTFSRVKTLG
jgi:hypothetical protein